MTEPLRFTLGECGAQALLLLRSDGPLLVAAVFERCFYLEAEGAFACLGGREIGLGPLSGRLDTPRGMSWPASGLKDSLACARTPTAIHLGGRFVLSLANARLWCPDPMPERPEPAGVARALERLQAVCAGRSALDGLPQGRDAVAAARCWLAVIFGSEKAGPGDPRGWLPALIGLGPGLTPSGDDFIGGMLIALHALGRAEAARLLASRALPLAESASNAISRALLAAAADGQASAALHRLLHDALRGDCDRMKVRLAAIGRIGHSSGWDTLAGIAAVLRAWLAVERVQRSCGDSRVAIVSA